MTIFSLLASRFSLLLLPWPSYLWGSFFLIVKARIMRLIRTSNLQLVEFMGDYDGKYAIHLVGQPAATSNGQSAAP
jgi:hypothetical protein